jgi:hypothetical protein
MTSLATTDQILKDIYDRVVAMNAETTALRESVVPEARILALVKEHLDTLKDDDPIVRKMRGWGAPATPLVGSKYARWRYTSADIEYLHAIQTSLRGQSRLGGGGVYQGPSEELDNAFKAVSSAFYMTDEEAKRIDRQAIDDMFPRIPKPEVLANFESRGAYRRARAEAVRALTMDTTESGFGTQLVGVQYVGDLWDAAFQESRIFALIRTFEMTAPTAYLPVAVDMPQPIFVAESTSDILATAQYPTVRTGSNRVSVAAKKLLIHQVWSGEMEEDSIIALVPFYRLQAARGLAFYSDSGVLNGDTQTGANVNINLIDSTPGSTAFYLTWDGMRKVGLLDNTANSFAVTGAVTLGTLRKMKGLMLDKTRYVDWGHPNDAMDLVFVADPQTADYLATLDEVIASKIMRAEQADLLNGQVASFLGHPVISTLAMGLTNSSGLISTTGSNNTYGQIVSFNRMGYVIGWRRRVRIEVERIPASDQTRLVYSYRLGLGRYMPAGAASGQLHSAVAYGINLP